MVNCRPKPVCRHSRTIACKTRFELSHICLQPFSSRHKLLKKTYGIKFGYACDVIKYIEQVLIHLFPFLNFLTAFVLFRHALRSTTSKENAPVECS